MRRLTLLLCGVLMTIAACGGDSVEDSDVQPTVSQPAGDANEGSDPGSQAPPTTDASIAGGDSTGEGPSTATVTIGDVIYTASSEGAVVAQCLTNVFGIFSVVLPLTDGGDGGIEIIALHEGTDPVAMEQDNRVTVKIGDIDWIADPEDIRLGPDEVALSRVETVVVNGSTVTGTATFAGRDLTTQGGWETMEGTFEATCGEERTS